MEQRDALNRVTTPTNPKARSPRPLSEHSSQLLSPIPLSDDQCMLQVGAQLGRRAAATCPGPALFG